MIGKDTSIVMTTKEENMLGILKAVVAPETLGQIEKQGLPTSKWESWRYSSLPSFAPESSLVKSKTVNPTETEEATLLKFKNRMVFSAGHFNQELSSLPEGFKLIEENVNLGATDFITALSNGLAPKKYLLEVEKNVSLSSPFALIELAPKENKSECQVEGTSLVIKIGSSSKFDLVHLSMLSHDSEIEGVTESELWRNHKLDIVVGENANVSYTKLTSSNSQTLALSNVVVNVAAHATFKTTLVALGGKLTRQDVTINLVSEGAHGEIRSLAALRQEEQADLSAFIYHKVPRTTSAQLVKNILDDKSRGVFTGKILIEREAIEVDSSQLSRALLLSKKAQMNARPQLEIYADDVKASHGATIGQLSEEELFYLQSRGLTSEKARQMLCHGFGLEITEEIASTVTKTLIEETLYEGFERYSIANKSEEA